MTYPSIKKNKMWQKGYKYPPGNLKEKRVANTLSLLSCWSLANLSEMVKPTILNLRLTLLLVWSHFFTFEDFATRLFTNMSHVKLVHQRVVRQKKFGAHSSRLYDTMTGLMRSCAQSSRHSDTMPGLKRSCTNSSHHNDAMTGMVSSSSLGPSRG